MTGTHCLFERYHTDEWKTLGLMELKRLSC
jgi:hypothetical protein